MHIVYIGNVAFDFYRYGRIFCILYLRRKIEFYLIVRRNKIIPVCGKTYLMIRIVGMIKINHAVGRCLHCGFGVFVLQNYRVFGLRFHNVYRTRVVAVRYGICHSVDIVYRCRAVRKHYIEVFVVIGIYKTYFARYKRLRTVFIAVQRNVYVQSLQNGKRYRFLRCKRSIEIKVKFAYFVMLDTSLFRFGRRFCRYMRHDGIFDVRERIVARKYRKPNIGGCIFCASSYSATAQKFHPCAVKFYEHTDIRICAHHTHFQSVARKRRQQYLRMHTACTCIVTVKHIIGMAYVYVSAKREYEHAVLSRHL